MRRTSSAPLLRYRDFDVLSLPLDDWRERWLPGLVRDGLPVGLNWSGPNATGFDLRPTEVEEILASRADAGE